MLGMDAEPRMQARPIRHIRTVYWIATVLLLAAGEGWAVPEGSTGGDWDEQRYIGVDEIEPGMEAYCLTDYGEAGIEKFPLKVVNVVRGYEPGHDLILVIGTDDRFKHTGPVSGCSGSPVYIKERLAGALARSWYWAKDPLYGVTPIREMLAVGAGTGTGASTGAAQEAALHLDFSEPIDVVEADKQFAAATLLNPRRTSGPTALPCPLLVSGLPADACGQLTADLEAMGFAAVPGLSGTVDASEAADASLKPGGVITVPLVAGDIRMTALGTVTEVRDGKVYAFGHDYLGYGAVDLPMAGGKVYTVVASPQQSFKLGTSAEIIGAIRADEATAIFGEIGAKPRMVPLSIRIERYNDPEVRTYECQVAYNRLLTSRLARLAFLGAAFQRGSFPPDHTIEYKVDVRLDDGQSIRFENRSAGMGMGEASAEIGGALGLLMNSPYKGADVESLDFSVRIMPRDISAYLWSVDVADPEVKPGEDIEIEFVVESLLMEKRKYQVRLTVPEDVRPGKYGLMLLGIYEYENFIRKAMPYRFIATNYQTLVDALNESLNYDRTKLYCLLVLQSDGIMLDKAELPDLPGTKSLILQSSKRSVRVQPYPHWIEKTVETGTVIADKEIVPIVVEKK